MVFESAACGRRDSPRESIQSHAVGGQHMTAVRREQDFADQRAGGELEDAKLAAIAGREDFQSRFVTGCELLAIRRERNPVGRAEVESFLAGL